MTTLMRNDRDRRSGKPGRGHARKERVLLFGTRSADYIRASSQCGCIQRPNTWLHPNVSLNCPIFPLHRGRRPYMAPRVVVRRCNNSVAFGAKRTSNRIYEYTPLNTLPQLLPLQQPSLWKDRDLASLRSLVASEALHADLGLGLRHVCFERGNAGVQREVFDGLGFERGNAAVQRGKVVAGRRLEAVGF